jgi:hypothetical protein
LIVAVVCDGCGSGAHSEVGAWLGANMVATALFSHCVKGYLDFSRVLERVRQDVLAGIRVQANLFGGSFSSTINDYFLFTTVGVVMNSRTTHVFTIGDGVCGMSFKSDYEHVDGNRTFHSFGPFPDNCPPYMAYDLVESSIDPDLLKFKLYTESPTYFVDAVAIGSDGLEDLQGAYRELIPGSNEVVGSFRQFWEDDRYFDNPEFLNRRLRRMNSEVVRVDKESGRKVTFPRLLPDDTTLVSIRRKPCE